MKKSTLPGDKLFQKSMTLWEKWHWICSLPYSWG